MPKFSVGAQTVGWDTFFGKLQFVEKRLNNCLENRYDSQVKYVMRARQRTSSFWSFTFTYDDEPDAKPIFAMLAEVCHLPFKFQKNFPAFRLSELGMQSSCG